MTIASDAQRDEDITVPRIITGSPVRGDELYGRDAELQRAWESFENSSLLLTGPRRHGKTSVMYGIRDQPLEGWSVVFVNVEYLDDPADLIEMVLAGLLSNQPIRRRIRRLATTPARLGDWIAGLVDEVDAGIPTVGQIRISLRERRPTHDWEALGGLLTDLLSSLGENARHLVIIDEFPVFVEHVYKNSAEVARGFLHWFRSARQTFPQVRFLLGGSINLEYSLARRGDSALINDLEVLRLRPFNPETSRAFTRSLLEDRKHTPAESVEPLAEAICSVVGAGVPFYLQLVTGEVVDAIRIDGYPPNAKTVQRVYAERVLGPDCRTRFDHYRSRLSDYYAPENAAIARAILALLSDGDAHLESDLFARLEALGLSTATGEQEAEVLHQLEADYYISRQGGRCGFQHRILADWWRVNIPSA